MKLIEKGVGDYQIARSRKAETKILEILSDGKMHRYGEIVKKTGLSTATVTKHLKKLEEEGYVIKQVDLESGEYPYPVLYKLTTKGESFKEKEIFKDEIDCLNLIEIKISKEDIAEVAKLFLAPPLFEDIIKKASSKAHDFEKFEEMARLLADFMANYNASLCSIRFLVPKGAPVPVLERTVIFSLYEALLVCGVFKKKHPIHIIMSYNPDINPLEKMKNEVMNFYLQKGFKKEEILRFFSFLYKYQEN